MGYSYCLVCDNNLKYFELSKEAEHGHKPETDPKMIQLLKLATTENSYYKYSRTWMYNHKSISTGQIETIKKNQMKILETEVSYLNEN